MTPVHANSTLKGAAIALNAALIAGCPGRDATQEPWAPPPPPRPTEQIIDVVNQNSERFAQPLYGHVSASAKLVDDKGKSHTLDLGGRLAMQPPRSLWLRLDHALDADQMEIGSNDTEYWLKLRQDAKTLWWGRHENVGKPCAESLMVEPQLVSDALGTAPLRAAGRDPKRVTEPRVDRLVYERGAAPPAPRQCEYWIDRYPPHMIRKIIYRDGQGQVQMTITRDDYHSVGADGPLLARKIDVEWPAKGSWMKFRIDSMDVRPLNPATFVRPTAPSGIKRIVQVDAECDRVAVPAVGSVPANAGIATDGGTAERGP